MTKKSAWREQLAYERSKRVKLSPGPMHGVGGPGDQAALRGLHRTLARLLPKAEVGEGVGVDEGVS